MDDLKAPAPNPPSQLLSSEPGAREPSGGVVSPTKPLCGDEQDPYVVNTRHSKQRDRIEIVSQGIDDALQGIGGNPYGGLTSIGMRVPAFVNNAQSRYLFQLAAFQVPEGRRARIVGMRQGWTLGLRQANSTRVVEQWVTNPFFKLPDGNISWHLRQMPLGYPFLPRPGGFDPAANFPAPLQSFQFLTSDGSALLYQTAGFPAPTGFYNTLNAYTPPNRGMPWGNPIVAGELGTFYDLKTQWADGNDWSSLDIPVEGPKQFALFASVLQTNPNPQSPPGRTPLAITSPPPAFFQQGLSAEEQFLQNFPTAIIWRVAGALIVELEDYKP